MKTDRKKGTTLTNIYSMKSPFSHKSFSLECLQQIQIYILINLIFVFNEKLFVKVYNLRRNYKNVFTGVINPLLNTFSHLRDNEIKSILEIFKCVVMYSFVPSEALLQFVSCLCRVVNLKEVSYCMIILTKQHQIFILCFLY